jgi:ribosomal protein L19
MKVNPMSKNKSKVLLYDFSIPSFLKGEQLDLSERQSLRVCPTPGDLIFVRYFDRIPGKLTVFRVYACYGLCIGRKRSGITTTFTIRNSFKRNSIEMKFLLYSPFLARIGFFNSKRKRYKQAKLYYLRWKKIKRSRFRFEDFIKKLKLERQRLEKKYK